MYDSSSDMTILQEPLSVIESVLRHAVQHFGNLEMPMEMLREFSGSAAEASQADERRRQRRRLPHLAVQEEILARGEGRGANPRCVEVRANESWVGLVASCDAGVDDILLSLPSWLVLSPAEYGALRTPAEHQFAGEFELHEALKARNLALPSVHAVALQLLRLGPRP